MLILALDTSLAACSVALWRNGGIIAHRSEQMPRGHSERLIPMVGEAMREAGIDYSAVTRIASTIGPGSFTGVRIALAAARGFSLSCNVPLVGLTTLEVVAYAASRGATERPAIFAVLDAGRPDVFFQFFDAALAPLSGIEAAPPDEAARRVPSEPVLLAGNGAARLRAFLGERRDIRFAPGAGLPDAADVAALAAIRGAAPAGGAKPAPVYVHAPYAKRPRDKAR